MTVKIGTNNKFLLKNEEIKLLLSAGLLVIHERLAAKLPTGHEVIKVAPLVTRIINDLPSEGLTV